jgi:hypothetical protein
MGRVGEPFAGLFRDNVEVTLLASAVRSATTPSGDQINYNARGVLVVFDVTAVPTVNTVNCQIQAKDPVSGKYVTLADSGAQATAGTYTILVYPGATDTDTKLTAKNDIPLPRTWRVNVVHSAATNFTYSVGGSYIL